MPLTRRGDVRLFYDSAGSSGPPVLLVMGLAFPGEAWKLQIDALAPRFRVAWIDNRGAGRSDAPHRLYSIGDMAADSVAVLDALGWEDAHLVGISLGGMIIQRLALDHPARVRSLALIATAAGPFLPPAEGARYFLPVHFSGSGWSLPALARLLMPPEHLARVDREAVYSGFREYVGPRPDRLAGLAQLMAALGHNVVHRLPELEGTPTLVVQPGRDFVIPERESVELAAAIPGARLVRMPASGHGVLLQQPEELNRVLIEHFDRVELGRIESGRATAGAPA